jgi:hypothetical protein
VCNKALPGIIFLCIFSSPYLPEETCFQQVGSSAEEGSSQPVIISKKWEKNPGSDRKTTWVQFLPWFFTCSLGLPASGIDLKSRKGLYSQAFLLYLIKL